MQIITRAEAKEKGLKRYFTGKPCKHGHICERTTSEGKCVECKANNNKKYCARNKEKISQKKKEYAIKNKDYIANRKKEYAKLNKEHIAKYHKKYQEKNKEKIQKQRKSYYNQNKELWAYNFQKYYQQNREKLLEYQKKYSKENKEKISQRSKIWREKNLNVLKPKKRAYGKYYSRTEKGKVIAANNAHRRRTLTKSGDVTTSQLIELQKIQTHCYWCGTSLKGRVSHVDHYIPLSKGGKHTISNLVMACAKCNLSKGAKMPEEYAMHLGRLL